MASFDDLSSLLMPLNLGKSNELSSIEHTGKLDFSFPELTLMVLVLIDDASVASNSAFDPAPAEHIDPIPVIQISINSYIDIRLS